jgi:coenzyme PQQ precursor peptide PqqA
MAFIFSDLKYIRGPTPGGFACAILCTLTGTVRYRKLSVMQWTEPQIEEISLGCEINSYACAEI